MKKYTTPLKLIKLLSDGNFHSGEQLGQELGMSRAAINKHIQVIRDWGIDLFTVTGKGYSLPRPIELLDSELIEQHLPQGHFEVVPIIDSTNQYLLDHQNELMSGDAVVAEYQSAGRGRRGRQWFSPFGSNLYLSMFWRLEQGPSAVIGLSLVIGIVMAEVLHKLGTEGVKVKWPNDLYRNDKKLAGILVELTGKAGDSANIVIGIGINLAMSNPDADVVNQQWINLYEDNTKGIDRNLLSAELIKALRKGLAQFEQEGFAPFMARWDALDNFINRPVKLLIGNREIKGIARGIDDRGALLLEREGRIEAFIGGEISLRADNS